MAGIKAIFGGAGISADHTINTPDGLKQVMHTLRANGVDTIDTAQLYGMGESEQLIGMAGAGSSFTFDTKACGGFMPGTSTKESIVKDAKDSMNRLGVKQVPRLVDEMSRSLISEHPEGRRLLPSCARQYRSDCGYARRHPTDIRGGLVSALRPVQLRRGAC